MKYVKNTLALVAAALFIFSVTNMGKVVVSADYITEGKAECVMELNSRRILYESRGELRLPMASTTKILTAATVLEPTSFIQ